VSKPPTTAALLSVVIITKNEAKNIAACIDAVPFASEVLVVDSGSDDETVLIAERGGARVIHEPWRGFGEQKHFAVTQARHDWVLCLDADERVSPELARSIKSELSAPRANAYQLPMQQLFLCRMLKYGDGYPLWKLRLFHRSHAQWSRDPIHETVVTTEAALRLSGKLLHVPTLTLHEWIAKQNQYTQLQANNLHAHGKRATIVKLLGNPTWRFVKYYVLQRGFLDGTPGLVHAVLNAAFVFSKYAKLWALQKNTDSQNSGER
jgi:hypothetical protein